MIIFIGIVYFQAFTLNLKLETRQRPINPVFKKWTLENWQNGICLNMVLSGTTSSYSITELQNFVQNSLKSTQQLRPPQPLNIFSPALLQNVHCNRVVCNMDFDIRLENGGPKARFLIKNTKNVGKYRDFYLKWYFRNNLSVILNYIKLIY